MAFSPDSRRKVLRLPCSVEPVPPGEWENEMMRKKTVFCPVFSWQLIDQGKFIYLQIQCLQLASGRVSQRRD